MLSQIEKIIVIAGCQRSGTTLTGQILGSHRQALLIDETDGLYEWFEAADGTSLPDGEMFEELIKKADTKYNPAHLRISTWQNRRKLEPEIDHLILKAPNLTYSFEKLAALDIEVSVLFPVRDPRAVVASMARIRHADMIANQANWMEKSTAVKAAYSDEIGIIRDPKKPPYLRQALIWKVKSGMFTEFERAGLKPFIFRYEDLISDKEKVCRQIAKHTGLPFDRRMLRHQKFFRGMGPGLTDRTRPVDKFSVMRWKNRIGKKIEREILKIAEPLASKFNYTDATYRDFDRDIPKFSRETFESPVILTGRGGSGTRVLAELVQKGGIFIGNRLNASGDSMEWVDTIYEYAIKKIINHLEGKPYEIKYVGPILDRAQDILEQGNYEIGAPWGLKLPEAMLIAPELMQIFPKAKLVHLVRHPVTSCLRRTHTTSRTDNPVGRTVLKVAYSKIGRDPALIQKDPEYLNNAISWLYQVQNIHDFAMNHLTGDNYHLVKFEDLCDQPIQTTRKLTRFLGVQGYDTLRPNVDRSRLPEIDMQDPAVNEIWSLCRSFATEIGYSEIPPGLTNPVTKASSNNYFRAAD